MVAERKVIEVTELSEPGRLARELSEHPEGVAIGEHGRVIGTIMPETDLDSRLTEIPVHGVDGSPLLDGRTSPEQVERLLATFKPKTTLDAEPSAVERPSVIDAVSGTTHLGSIEKDVHDDWYAQWKWNRRFDHGVVDIGNAIGPLPRFAFSAERLNLILGIIGRIKDLDAHELRRIVDQSRQLPIEFSAEDEQAINTILN